MRSEQVRRRFVVVIALSVLSRLPMGTSNLPYSPISPLSLVPRSILFRQMASNHRFQYPPSVLEYKDIVIQRVQLIAHPKYPSSLSLVPCCLPRRLEVVVRLESIQLAVREATTPWRASGSHVSCFIDAYAFWHRWFNLWYHLLGCWYGGSKIWLGHLMIPGESTVGRSTAWTSERRRANC